MPGPQIRGYLHGRQIGFGGDIVEDPRQLQIVHLDPRLPEGQLRPSDHLFVFRDALVFSLDTYRDEPQTDTIVTGTSCNIGHFRWGQTDDGQVCQ